MQISNEILVAVITGLFTTIPSFINTYKIRKISKKPVFNGQFKEIYNNSLQQSNHIMDIKKDMLEVKENAIEMKQQILELKYKQTKQNKNE